MEFLNPGILWGALAISLPVILHFWHQKRGKELPWAASRWLSGLVLQKSRGIRLENLLLLILRCLLLLLLVFWLSEPLFKRLTGKQEKVHWIQPDKAVVENFRFELEEAEKRGEKRFWFNGEPVTALSILPEDTGADLQLGINKVRTEGQAEIYLSGTDDFTRFSRVYLPEPYRLHPLSSRFGEPGGGEALSADRLMAGNDNPSGGRVRAKGAQGEGDTPSAGKVYTRDEPGVKGDDKSSMSKGTALTEVRVSQIGGSASRPLKVLLESEKASVSAALKAITDVYGLHFEVDSQRQAGRRYDLVFSHEPDSSAELSVVSAAAALPANRMTAAHRVIWFNERLTAETSDAVFNGQLPEILLEALVKDRPALVLSDRQLRDKFAVRPPRSIESSFHSVILVLFILALGAERWFAIHKNS